jgi:hypothetical protein
MRPTPKGVFYFAHMGELTFTNVEESARKSLGITRDEYALCNYVQTWAVLPGNRTPGFCNRTRQQMAAFIGITERGILKMLGRMENEGLIERGGGFIFRITEKWFSAVVVAKTEREQSSPSNVNKVHPKREQSSPSNVNKVHPHIQNKETEVNRIQRQNAKNEFSPDPADGSPEYRIEVFEPMKVETVRLGAEKQKTSNGARRDVLQPGGNAADLLAPNWNTPEKARAMSANLGDDFAEMLEKEYGVKVVTVPSSEPIPETLGKARKTRRMDEPQPFPETVEAFSHFSNPDKIAALWKRWLCYKKDQHRERYKTADSEITQLRQLWKRAGGDADKAEQIIEQSIGNLWKGLFDLKIENANGAKSTSSNRESVRRQLVEIYADKRRAAENQR